MKQFTLTNTSPDFVVVSYGNGTAYAVTDKRTGKDILVQGDDAIQWEEETQEFTNTSVLRDYFDMLTQ